MALTPEVIKANEALAELTDDQVTALATLSVNDENNVISAKIGELHGGYDKDIFEVSGIEKQQGEKSYDYAKRVLGEFKSKAESSETLSKEIGEYKTTISDLQKQIKEGNTDPAIKQQLKDAEDKAATLQSQYDTDKQNWEKEKEDYGKKLTSVKVNTQFEKALGGLKFKPEYPKEVQETLVKSAKDSIMTEYTPDWIGEGENRSMVFRGKDGEIARNPENKLNPFTAQELLASKLASVIDKGKSTKGAGTGDKGGDHVPVTLTGLAGAKTQVEASDLITSYLLEKGVLRTSSAFAEEQKKLWKDNKIDALPLR